MKKRQPAFLTRKHPPDFRPSSHAYPSLDCQRLADDMASLEHDIGIFAARYRSKRDDVTQLSASRLRTAIDMYEDIQARLYRIELDCDLREALPPGDPARIAELRDWASKVDAKTGFFEAWIGDIDKARFDKLVRDEALAPHAAWLKHQRAEHKHMLQAGAENEHRKGFVGDVQALRHAYREHRESIEHTRVTALGRRMSFQRAERELEFDRTTGAEKKEIADALSKAMQARARHSAEAYNALMGDTLHWTKERKYRRPEDLEGHGLPPKVMKMLTDIVGGASSHLMKKSRQIAETGEAAQKQHWDYSWPEEVAFIMRVARRFSPDMAKFARHMLEERHVDARPRRGKPLEDEFMRAAAPGTLPYVVINAGKRQPDEMVHVDIHELLGHGYDAHRAQKRHGHLSWRSGAAVEETKALVMEMFGYGVLVRAEKNADWKRQFEIDWVERMLQNGPHQLARHAFEKAAHDARKDGPLRTRTLCRLWAKAQKQHGARDQWPHDKRYGWMMDTHFTETPFRAAAYAFALVAAVNFCSLYEKAEAKGEGARRKFIRDYRREFVDPGGTRTLHGLFKPFGLDPMQPAFYRDAVDWIGKRIDKLVAGNPKPAAVKAPAP